MLHTLHGTTKVRAFYLAFSSRSIGSLTGSLICVLSVLQQLERALQEVSASNNSKSEFISFLWCASRADAEAVRSALLLLTFSCFCALAVMKCAIRCTQVHSQLSCTLFALLAQVSALVVCPCCSRRAVGSAASGPHAAAAHAPSRGQTAAFPQSMPCWFPAVVCAIPGCQLDPSVVRAHQYAFYVPDVPSWPFCLPTTPDCRRWCLIVLERAALVFTAGVSRS